MPIQENQDFEYPRRFATGWYGWFEENRQTHEVNACSNCDYFMRGYKSGELGICNAFHAIADVCTPNDCTDWKKS